MLNGFSVRRFFTTSCAALTAWTYSAGMLYAQDGVEGVPGAAEDKAYAVIYPIVFLVIALGVAAVARPEMRAPEETRPPHE